MRSSWTGLVSLLVAIGIITSAAGAVLIVASMAPSPGYVRDDHGGRAVIAPGAFFEFEFVVYARVREIGFSFQVESGPRIDIYLLTPEDRAAYAAGQPVEARPPFAFEKVMSATGSPYLGEGRFHAIIDNTDYGAAKSQGETATVTYGLVAGGVPGQDDTEAPITRLVWLGLGILVEVVGVVLLVVGLLLRSEAGLPSAATGQGGGRA